MVETSLKQTRIRLDGLPQNTLIALVIKVAGLVLTYSLQVILARWMGMKEYGIYAYVISWTLLLSVPAKLGLPITVLRYIPQYKVKQEWGRFWGLVRSSFTFILGASFVVSILGTGIIWLLNQHHSFAYAKPLLIGIWVVPLWALTQLQLEIARATNDISLAYAPSKIVQPILIFCGACFLLEVNGSLTNLSMIITSGLAVLGVILFQLWLLWEKLNLEFEAATPVYETREWLKVSFTLLVQGAFIIIFNQTKRNS